MVPKIHRYIKPLTRGIALGDKAIARGAAPSETCGLIHPRDICKKVKAKRTEDWLIFCLQSAMIAAEQKQARQDRQRMSKAEPRLIFRQLKRRDLLGAPLMDAILDPASGLASYVFFTGAEVEAVARAMPGKPQMSSMIAGAPVLRGRPVKINHAAAEHGLFAGRNALIATRNGEAAEVIADWLLYHATHFDLGGAVIFERAQPGTSKSVWQRVRHLLKKAGRDVIVVVMECDQPLGEHGLGPETHPINVAEAPGHDRMEIPPPSPWDAPLGESQIFQLAYERFLKSARAFANLDLHDLMLPTGDQPDPFTRAQTGMVEMVGQHCYPWRGGNGEDPHYRDHICVQFDKPKMRKRWCVSPALMSSDSALKYLKISDLNPRYRAGFHRFVAVRHRTEKASHIVPKTSLVESQPLIDLMKRVFDAKPVRAPDVQSRAQARSNTTTIVTTMKNEGPFIVEWLAYHRAIGVTGFLVYTNDCDDGTDRFFDLLQEKGIVQHRDNKFREMDLKPQHAALQMAEDEPIMQEADWLICMDVDEFINVKVGDGRLEDLYAAVPDANMISCTWRLFGNSDRHDFADEFTIGQFDRCAEEYSPKPHQAWGFKTLFRNIGLFKKMGVHRPKGLRPQLWEEINWVNGSGNPLPRNEFRNAWRSTTTTYGYDLVALNHYAVRNAESFLVKRDRGRVNHVDRDQGLAYWFRMNNNAVEERSIMKRIEMMRVEFDKLMSDPEIAAQHHACVAAHRAKIDSLKARPDQQQFFDQLTSARMERLSRLHRHFGANVFLSGPDCVPEEVTQGEVDQDFFFTVERGETAH
jgi:hypothetical protein